MRKDFERAYVTAHDKVAVLTLNHPEAMNAASLKLMAGASEALKYIKASGFRAMVITGEGRGFCSGANLSELSAGGDLSTAGDALEVIYHPFLRKLREFKLPILTAVNGAAAGIGMSLAMMGDIICASKSAYFVQSFSRVGLVPDGGSSWMLPRVVGAARARELSLLAEKLPAEKALEWGMINRVFEDDRLIQDTLAIATQLANGPTFALNLIRQLYTASPHNSFEEQIDMEARLQTMAAHNPDFWEGVAAFMQKRPANFSGQ